MSIEPEPSRNLTADECEELAAVLLEDAAGLPPGKKRGNSETSFRLSRPRQNEAFGIAQCELTMFNPVSR